MFLSPLHLPFPVSLRLPWTHAKISLNIRVFLNFLKCAQHLNDLKFYNWSNSPTISPSRIPSVLIIWIVFIKEGNTIPGGIWKHGFDSENASATLRRRKKVQQLALFWGKLRRINHMIIMTPLFSKTSVFKTFSVHTNVKSWRSQIPPVWGASSKSSAFENRARTRCGIALRLKQTAKVVSDYLLPSKNMIEELHLFLMILAKKGMFGIGL